VEPALRILAVSRDQLRDLTDLMIAWREPLLFVLLVAECVPLLGLASPGLIALVLAGFVGHELGYSAALRLYATALVAVSATDLLLFAAGRAGAVRLPLVQRWVGERATFGRALAGQRDAMLMLYQFPPYSRMFAPLLLGAAALGWTRWLRVAGAGTLLFVSSFFLIGFSAHWLSSGIDGAAAGAGFASSVFGLGLGAWIAVLVVRIWKSKGAER
jgi:membrane protein DedA with SNARE-associated domain